MSIKLPDSSSEYSLGLAHPWLRVWQRPRPWVQVGGDLRHSISKLVSLGIPEVCLLKAPWESITRSKAVKSLRFCLTRKPPLFHGSGGKGDSGVRAGGCSSSVRAGSWGPSSQGHTETARWALHLSNDTAGDPWAHGTRAFITDNRPIWPLWWRGQLWSHLSIPLTVHHAQMLGKMTQNKGSQSLARQDQGRTVIV